MTTHTARIGPPPASVGFLGFYPGWDPTSNDLTKLMPDIPLEVSLPDGSGHLPVVPRFLFYSVFGGLHEHPRYDTCTKIYTTQENFRPPWDACDYALTGDYTDDPRHLRLPAYAQHMLRVTELPGYSKLAHPCPTLVKGSCPDLEDVVRGKTRFCNFLYSNSGWRDPRAGGPSGLDLRVKFLELLSRYKTVDSGGEVANNLGHQVVNKLPFLEPYKFTIAFENASYPGYVSEKLVDPMFAWSVPIYWGSPLVADDFCPRSMVVATGRKLEDVVDEVVALDQDDAAYLAKLRVPWFEDDVPNRYCRPDYLTSFLELIFRGVL